MNKMEKTLKLNQVIAISGGEKTRKQSELSKIYQKLQKPALFEGISRRYIPRDDDGDSLPPEDKFVQYSTKEAINEARAVMDSMFNIVATQDLGNCDAEANVVVNDETILHGVPVTHLIFLEKQLEDIHTLVKSLPVLDPGEQWSFDRNAMVYSSEAKETTKTKKMAKPIVKYEATKEHPAQVDVVNEDVIIGDWRTTKFSGNISKTEKEELLQRVRGFQKALKIAREEANLLEVNVSKIGTKTLNYIFNGSNKKSAN